MCRFITAVVPTVTDLQASRPLLDNYGMSFKEIRNSFIEAQLGGDRYVRATRSVCDCDSALGSASDQQETSQADRTHAAEIEKLRKKGWSQHKIERWLAEKSGSSDRHQRQDQSNHDAELTHWREFIGALLSDGFTKRLGLLLHMYNGRLEDEQIRIKRIELLSLSGQLDKALLAMDEDVLYMVSKN
jgi:hypothetical protein